MGSKPVSDLRRIVTPYWARMKPWEETNHAVDVMRIELSVAEVCKTVVMRKLKAT